MTTHKRKRDKVDLQSCLLHTLPTHTLTIDREYDVLYRLLELLPEKYASKSPMEQRIPEELIVRIILEARTLIASEPIVVELESPVYVCGDIHGQYYDLINIFTRCPPLNGTVFPTLANIANEYQSREGTPNNNNNNINNNNINNNEKSMSNCTNGSHTLNDNKSSDKVSKKLSSSSELTSLSSLSRPSSYNFLFLGDYVDRGSRSIEVVVTLLALKIIEPTKLFMLRGNHEDEQIMYLYGFYDECKRRYGLRLFKIFADLFRVLPVAAVINKSIFCMHGGLSSEMYQISDIPDPRPCTVPHSGILCDLLWADPEIDLPPNVDWAPSSRRISNVFSAAALERFLINNDLDLICRAHQVVEEGFQFFPSNHVRQLLTIFSASNYCNEFGNRGGVLCVDEDGVASVITMEPPSFIQQRHILLVRDNVAIL